MIEWLWPWPRPATGQQRSPDVEIAPGFSCTSALLEEARRQVEEERDTRSGVETRAGICLATIGAMVPIVAVVVDSLVSDSPMALFGWAVVGLAVLSAVYLLGAGWWALKAVEVKTWHVVHVRDVVELTAKGNEFELGLATELLRSVSRNRDTVNDKVEAIKTATRFLWRSILVLTLMLVSAALSPLASSASGLLVTSSQAELPDHPVPPGAHAVPPEPAQVHEGLGGGGS